MYIFYFSKGKPLLKKIFLQDSLMDQQTLPQTPPQPPPRTGFTAAQTLGIVAVAMLITAVATIFVIKLLLFPPPFEPVTLSAQEEQQLETKLAIFEGLSPSHAQATQGEEAPEERVTPEKYVEDDTARKVDFTEREINAMVAKNTDLADKVAVDLSQDLVSVKILIPLSPDFPVLGGKTFKVNAGAELAYREGRPVVKLKGVSLMGVPMPNSWLGGLKNIDLISEFGADEGFWKAFADGVESIGVEEGLLKLQLKP